MIPFVVLVLGLLLGGAIAGWPSRVKSDVIIDSVPSESESPEFTLPAIVTIVPATSSLPGATSSDAPTAKNRRRSALLAIFSPRPRHRDMHLDSYSFNAVHLLLFPEFRSRAAMEGGGGVES